MAAQRFLNNFDTYFYSSVYDLTHSGYETVVGRGILEIPETTRLETLTDGDWYTLTAYKRSGSVESEIEIIKVLEVYPAVGGVTKLRVERGAELTTPKAYTAGGGGTTASFVSMRLTAGGLNSLASDAELATKEATIAAGTTSQFWRGDKSWQDLFTQVRAATLTGLSTATSTVVDAADTVLAALGKLQAQITGHTSNTSNPHSVTKAQVGLGNVDNTSNATERAATATLTNKTLTNPTINGFTGDTSAINIGGEQIVKDTSGNVGIGVNNSGGFGGAKLATLDGISMVQPGSKLHLYYISSTNRAWIGSETGGEITLGTGLSAPTERMHIATDGTTTFVSAAFGYGAGAGGTVAQVTSKATGVTLNKPSMTINTFRQAWTTNEERTFIVTNSFVGTRDTINVSLLETGIGADSLCINTLVRGSPGSFYVSMRNVTGGALADTQITLQLNVIKGSST